MTIDGETRIVAILGDPVAQAQAKSPELFNALFERHAVNAVLIPMQVPPAQLGVVLDGLRRVVNLAGVVVTVPHKIVAAAYAADLSGAARRLSASARHVRYRRMTSSSTQRRAACRRTIRSRSILPMPARTR